LNADLYLHPQLPRWAVIKDARRRQRRRLRRRALLAVLAAAPVAVALFVQGPAAGLRPARATMLERTSTGNVGGQVLQARDIDGRFWVLSCTSACRTPPIGHDTEQLVEFGDQNGAVLRRFELPGHNADAFTVTARSFWIAHFLSGVVTRYNIATGRPEASVQLRLPKPVAGHDRSALPLDLNYSVGYVWASGARGLLAQIDPRSGRLAQLFTTPGDSQTIVDRYGSWVADDLGGLGLLRLHGIPGFRLKPHPIMQDGYPLDVAAVFSSSHFVWGLAYTSELGVRTRTIVLVIDPQTGRTVHRVQVPNADGVVVAGHELYLGALARGRIYRVDASGALRTFRVGPRRALLEAAAPGRLWAATTGDPGRLISLRLPGA
jgi:hypothetical protein